MTGIISQLLADYRLGLLSASSAFCAHLWKCERVVERQMEIQNTVESQSSATQCLHLGRSGERCLRAALEDGFCEWHGPDAAWRFNIAARRRIFAVLIAAAVLWPILLDLWHALHH